MRQLILDTETTGLDPKLGHRIIEIAAVELVHRRPTGRHLHFRVDPGRDVDAAAAEVHGMTWDDLKGQPRFHEVAGEFAEFTRGAEWIIHNAPFDVAFLDYELSLAGMPACDALYGRLTDSLELARESFPGKRNGLDALCERFGISNAHRTLHGALLDARLLADVYLAMTRGQETLVIDLAVPSAVIAVAPFGTGVRDSARPPLRVIAPSDDELAEHRAYLEALDRESKGRCVWLAAAAGAAAVMQ
ncbi:MAG TPA: DNA polymerase III subunit epsilon [Casimicrobiaceae bacterium]|nr:DNA polymerase III subunit epsilon [Casimicrobiaceae bacterium]